MQPFFIATWKYSSIAEHPTQPPPYERNVNKIETLKNELNSFEEPDILKKKRPRCAMPKPCGCGTKPRVKDRKGRATQKYR
jgi:hypothetical protein